MPEKMLALTVQEAQIMITVINKTTAPVEQAESLIKLRDKIVTLFSQPNEPSSTNPEQEESKE